ncbi:hypothetical protein KC341_g10 [Hortaea werneckii]|nr:hypothetical protein KC341_g10 [Hortaea werneckii]
MLKTVMYERLSDKALQSQLSGVVISNGNSCPPAIGVEAEVRSPLIHSYLRIVSALCSGLQSADDQTLSIKREEYHDIYTGGITTSNKTVKSHPHDLQRLRALMCQEHHPPKTIHLVDFALPDIALLGNGSAHIRSRHGSDEVQLDDHGSERLVALRGRRDVQVGVDDRSAASGDRIRVRVGEGEFELVEVDGAEE